MTLSAEDEKVVRDALERGLDNSVWGWWATDALEALLGEIDALRNQKAALEVTVTGLAARQQEHLALIARLSKETPFDNEIEDLRRQNAALIAEVGTLRARLSHR